MPHEDVQHFTATPYMTTILAIGSSAEIILEKRFGPTMFASLRIRADVERGWVIERAWMGDLPGATRDEHWLEWCVIPAQLYQEFVEGDEDEETPC